MACRGIVKSRLLVYCLISCKVCKLNICLQNLISFLDLFSWAMSDFFSQVLSWATWGPENLTTWIIDAKPIKICWNWNWSEKQKLFMCSRKLLICMLSYIFAAFFFRPNLNVVKFIAFLKAFYQYLHSILAPETLVIPFQSHHLHLPSSGYHWKLSRHVSTDSNIFRMRNPLPT